MMFIWLSYHFVLVILYICSIDLTLISLFNIFNFGWFIWLLSIVLFSPSFSSCYYGTLKRVYETSNLSNNAFFKQFVFEINLICHIIMLTFLASESLKLIQKTLHLKDLLFHQLLIPTKRYLWIFFFLILFTGSIWTLSFSWKVLTSAIFQSCFRKLPCMREPPSRKKIF